MHFTNFTKHSSLLHIYMYEVSIRLDYKEINPPIIVDIYMHVCIYVYMIDLFVYIERVSLAKLTCIYIYLYA